MSRRGKVLFALMGVIWGIPYLLIKVAIRDLAVPTLVFARTAPAAILLVPIAWRRGLVRPLVARWRAVVAYTAIEVAVPWFLLPSAEKQLSSSVSGLLIATVPLIGALVAVAVKSTERLDGRRLAGLLLGLAGVGVLVGIDLHGTDVNSVVEVLLTAVGYAIGPVIISRRFADLPGLGLVAVSFALVALGYAPGRDDPPAAAVASRGPGLGGGAELGVHHAGVPVVFRVDHRGRAAAGNGGDVHQSGGGGGPGRGPVG